MNFADSFDDTTIAKLPPEIQFEILERVPWATTKSIDELWKIKFRRLTGRFTRFDEALSWHDNFVIAADVVGMPSAELIGKYQPFSIPADALALRQATAHRRTKHAVDDWHLAAVIAARDKAPTAEFQRLISTADRSIIEVRQPTWYGRNRQSSTRHC